MRILITGGCGFIWSNLAIFLKGKIKNVKIISIDNLSRKGSQLNHKRLSRKGIKNFKINTVDSNKLIKLTKFCKDITNNTIRINSVKKTSPYDIPYYISNINYVKKLYKWKPKRDLKKIIADLYNWMKVNKLVLKKYF